MIRIGMPGIKSPRNLEVTPALNARQLSEIFSTRPAMQNLPSEKRG